MKRLLLLICLLALIIPAGATSVLLSHAAFYTPEGKSYVENYVQIDGASAKYLANENGVLQAKFSVTELFLKDDSIVAFKKYLLLGPELTDSIARDIIGQSRVWLEAGSYKREVEILDLNRDDAPAYKIHEKILVLSAQEGLFFSDVELVESFQKTDSDKGKSGLLITPLVFPYYPDDYSKLAFYQEVYNSHVELGKKEDFLVYAYIETYEKGVALKNYRQLEKKKTDKVVPLFFMFNIEQLGSGNYNLVVEIRNKENKIVDLKKHFFQRKNLLVVQEQQVESLDFKIEFDQSDSLKWYLASLVPIALDGEYNTIKQLLKTRDNLEECSEFFVDFWKRKSPALSHRSWIIYKRKILDIEDRYGSTLSTGYESPRGRVLLQYGNPDDIVQVPNDPNDKPYEIWFYYQTKQFTNAKFVFYNSSRFGNNYQLLHSNVRGEIQNKNWISDLGNGQAVNFNDSKALQNYNLIGT